MIIIICGLPGTGKTTLANELAPEISAVVLSSDRIRKEIFPKPTYSRDERRLVYKIMILLAKYLHGKGINCILDATFNLERSRVEVMEKIGISKQEIQIIECVCPTAVATLRLCLRKGDFSDATPSVYRKMQALYQPIRAKHISINTVNSPKDNVNIILQSIEGLNQTPRKTVRSSGKTGSP